MDKNEIWEDDKYVYISEELFKYLPLEMQQDLQARKQEGENVLQVVDKDIKNLIRLGNAFPAMISLRSIQYRLANTELEATVESMLEHDMLTTVFALGSQGSLDIIRNRQRRLTT